jgi:HSP20 family molecular chaperone IbpA
MAKNMAQELDKRRQEWTREVERMQDDFFKMKLPDDAASAVSTTRMSPSCRDDVTTSTRLSPGVAPFSLSSSSSSSPHQLQQQADGSTIFRARFDVHGYDPDEISVRVESGRRLVVNARHVDPNLGSPGGISREFNKRIDLPPDVDPTQLVSRLAYDGILTVEAPITRLQCDGDESPAQRAPPSYETLRTSRMQNMLPGDITTGNDDITYTSLSLPSPNKRLVASTGNGNVWRGDESNLAEDVALGSCGVVDTVDGCRILKLIIDLGRADYNPDDVRVIIVDERKLLVTARQLVTSPVTGVTSRREFSRELDVAEPIDGRTARAVLERESGRKLWIVAGVVTSSSGGGGGSRSGRAMSAGTLAGLLPAHGRPCTVELR